jgi:hypothetical protein
VADVSGSDDPPAAARALIEAGAMTPFDLAAGPPIRACLIRLGASDHVLGLSAHHMDFDEWSARILWRELSVLPLSRLPMITPDEMEQLIWQRNETGSPDPATSVLDMVMASTARRPDAPAMTYGGGTLTYAALRARACPVRFR